MHRLGALGLPLERGEQCIDVYHNARLLEILHGALDSASAEAQAVAPVATKAFGPVG